MFKGIHPVFWVGLAIMYGLTLMFMIIEMTNPGFTFNAKIGGAPAVFFYLCIFMNVFLNVAIAWAWFYFPEREDRRRAEKGVKSGVSRGGS